MAATTGLTNHEIIEKTEEEIKVTQPFAISRFNEPVCGIKVASKYNYRYLIVRTRIAIRSARSQVSNSSVPLSVPDANERLVSNSLVQPSTLEGSETLVSISPALLIDPEDSERPAPSSLGTTECPKGQQEAGI
ncbi:hypothetical protein MHYP_G00072890 [Metynnis hypsauchen]